MNAEEALRCIEIANRHAASGNVAGAIRFTKKAIALNPTSAATTLLSKFEKMEQNPPTASTSSSSNPSNSSSSSAPKASTSKPKPIPPKLEEKREFTPVQAALVKRVRSCKISAYYEILGIEKGCDDGTIKKAYRKVCYLNFEL